jgi:CRP-like cAMP-binding protein
MTSSKNDFKKAVEILNTPGTARSYEDLVFLSNYLLFLEEFRKYITRLNQVVRVQLCRVLNLEIYEKNKVIFSKGDPSDRYYIILRGHTESFNVDSSGNFIYLARSEPGKSLGERGIVRNLRRSCTVIAGESTVFLLTLTAADFKRILGEFVHESLEQKLKFVEKYIPGIISYSKSHKERLSYSLNLVNHKRGDVILEKDCFSEVLYFVYEGECSISIPQGNRLRNIVKIGNGSCFGEECVLFGLKSLWKITVASEFCVLGTISRDEILSVFPHDTIEAIKKNYSLKNHGRNLLVSFANEYIIDPELPVTKNLNFPQASKYARKRLAERVERSNPRIVKNFSLSPESKQALRRKLTSFNDRSPSPLLLHQSPMHLKHNFYRAKSNRLRLITDSSPNRISRSFTPKLGKECYPDISFSSSKVITSPSVRSMTPCYKRVKRV